MLHAEWYEIAALVISNLAFLLAAVRAYQFRRYIRTFLFVSVFMASSSYHFCKPINGMCALSYPVHFFLDFLFALGSIGPMLLYLIPFGPITVHGELNLRLGPTHSTITIHSAIPGRASHIITYPVVDEHYRHTQATHATYTRGDRRYIDTWLILLNLLAVGIVLGLVGKPPMLAMGIIIGTNFGIVGGAWWSLWYYYHIKPVLDWRDFGIAIGLAVIGIGLFIGADMLDPSFYWIAHSIWHVMGGVGNFYLLESRSLVHSGIWQVHPWPTHAHQQKLLPMPWRVYGQDIDLS